MKIYDRIPGCREAFAFIGHARHGKDTAARAMLKIVPGSERFAFSDFIATVARTSGGMTKRDPSLLQQIGYSMRMAKPDIWLDVLHASLMDREPEVIILTGLRFPDEIRMFNSLAPKTTVIRMRRWTDETCLVPFVSPDRDANHPVESIINSLKEDAIIDHYEGREDLIHFALRTSFGRTE